MSPQSHQNCHSCTQQVISFCSTFVPSIIKIFLRVFVLQSRDKKSNSNTRWGDNYKSKKGRVIILVCDTSSGPGLHFCHYNRNIPKGIPVTEQTRNLFQTKQMERTPKVRKPELSFLYATCHLVLFYISTKYHKNIPKGL